MEHAKIHSVERRTVYAGAYDNLNQNTMDRQAPSTINVKQSASPPIMGFLFTCGKCKQRFNTKEEVVEHTNWSTERRRETREDTHAVLIVHANYLKPR